MFARLEAVFLMFFDEIMQECSSQKVHKYTLNICVYSRYSVDKERDTIYRKYSPNRINKEFQRISRLSPSINNYILLWRYEKYI